MIFTSKKSFEDWLKNIIAQAILDFESQYNIKLSQFDDKDFAIKHSKEHYLMSAIYKVLDYFEAFKTNKSLLRAINHPIAKDEIWEVNSFRNLVKSIIEISYYTPNTKDSIRPDSLAHTNITKYLLKASGDTWLDPAFHELLLWYIEQTEISYRSKKKTIENENKKIMIWLDVQKLMVDGCQKTDALQAVAIGNNKADIRNHYDEVDHSNWAKGVGVYLVDNYKFKK
ncbi:hypothetical protein [uncultured Paraglaciecola sp.]|uniref:hypothetical protein n=1 Tax=uncultured Paraglaciecola sp. TaxID=1765024 RepID=UPI002628EB26|nr:hypothetical protein [uncultured Paraglaciecola sp.]